MGFDVEMERPTPIYIDQEDNYVLSDQEKILYHKVLFNETIIANSRRM